MADRMQMSQSMLDSYNAARYSYYQSQSAIVPSIQMCIRDSSGRYLDISGIETANGTPMIQCALNNGLNQRFQLEAVEGEEGYYYLIPGHAKEKVLQMGDSMYYGNPLMQLQDRTGGDNQKFQFIQNDNGTCLLYTSRCV